jgi:hypothetical protein
MSHGGRSPGTHAKPTLISLGRRRTPSTHSTHGRSEASVDRYCTHRQRRGGNAAGPSRLACRFGNDNLIIIVQYRRCLRVTLVGHGAFPSRSRLMICCSVNMHCIDFAHESRSIIAVLCVRRDQPATTFPVRCRMSQLHTPRGPLILTRAPDHVRSPQDCIAKQARGYCACYRSPAR